MATDIQPADKGTVIATRTAWLGVMLIMALALFAFAPPAMADVLPDTTSPAAKCDKYVGLTNKIAGCIRDTIDATAKNFFDDKKGFYALTKKAISATLTLAVMVYGILLAYGMVENVSRDSMVLLFKLAAVIYFTAHSAMIYDMAVKTMDNTASAIIKFIAPSDEANQNSGDTFSQATCMKVMLEEQAKGKDPSKAAGPWLGIDCLLDSVIGIRVQGEKEPSAVKYYNDVVKQDNKSTSRGLLYLFFGAMQSSSVGLAIAIIGGIFIWGLIILIIKSLFIYIAGYLGIAFISILSPLFIPLILFRSTKSYFDKWVRVMLSFMIQPIMIIIFVMFSLTAVDFATFSGKYSVWYRIAGEEAHTQGFDLNTYLSVPRKADGTVDTAKPPANTSTPILLDRETALYAIKTDNPTKAEDVKALPAARKDTGGAIPGMEYYVCGDKKKIAADKSGALAKYCSFQYDVSVFKKHIDWDMMAKARKGPPLKNQDGDKSIVDEGQLIANEVIASLLFAATVVFIMGGLFKVVPSIGYDIAGDFNQSVNLANVGGGKFDGGSNLVTDFSHETKIRSFSSNSVAGRFSQQVKQQAVSRKTP